MRGDKPPVPKLTFRFKLEAQVPGQSLLRQVPAIVNLSIASQSPTPCYSHTGQTGIDPVAPFKMVVISYPQWEYERAVTIRRNSTIPWLWMRFVGCYIDEWTSDH